MTNEPVGTATKEAEARTRALKSMRVALGPESKAALDAYRAAIVATERERTTNGCPCVLAGPCQPMCTCRSGGYSAGCLMCARYGSLGQRQAKAEQLIGERERTAALVESAQLRRNVLLHPGDTFDRIGEWVAIPREDFVVLRVALRPFLDQEETR